MTSLWLRLRCASTRALTRDAAHRNGSMMVDKPPADVIGAPLAAAPRRGAAVSFIFVTILLDMLAGGGVISILPPPVGSFFDKDTPDAPRVFWPVRTPLAAMQIFFLPLFRRLSGP